VVIAHGLPVYVALEPVDMRFGYERLGGIVREKCRPSLALGRCSRSPANGVTR
jgi:hypothetical protein